MRLARRRRWTWTRSAPSPTWRHCQCQSWRLIRFVLHCQWQRNCSNHGPLIALFAGVVTVIDTGKVKVRAFGATGSATEEDGAGSCTAPSGGTGMESLSTVNVSQAQAIQRAGRAGVLAVFNLSLLVAKSLWPSDATLPSFLAGREGPGTCYRLYTEADFSALPAQPVPEVCRVSVAATVLGLLAMGLSCAEVIGFPWLQAPPRAAQLEAFTLLLRLRAIAPQEQAAASRAAAATAAAPSPALPSVLTDFAAFALSPHGISMAALPLTPMYANLLLCAAASGVGADAAAVVALLSVDNVWVNPGRERRGALDAARRKFSSLEGDHTTLLNVFRSFERVVVVAAREVAEAALQQRSRSDDRTAAKAVSVVVYASDEDGEEGGAGDGTPGAAVASSGAAAVGMGGTCDLQEWVVHGGGGASDAAGRGGVKRTPKSASGSAAPLRLESISSTSCAAAIAQAVSAAASGAAAPSTGGRGGKAALRAITARALKWCVEHFVSLRSLRRAVAIRDQIADICAATGIDLARRALPLAGGGSDPTAAGLRRALAMGCWLQAAVRQQPAEPGGRPGYRPLVAGVGAASPPPLYFVHPGSVLVLVHSYVRNKQAAAAAARLLTGRKGAGGGDAADSDAALLGLGYPEAVVFGELVFTGKAYMRQCTRVELSWLAEACPEMLPHSRILGQ